MSKVKPSLFCLVALILILGLMIKVSLASNLQDDINKSQQNRSGLVLSRKRRYLVFPEGSSLQLVFCLTIPTVGMSQIFTVGSTAALAWELPHDPFAPFRRHAELLHRVDVKPPKYDQPNKIKITNNNSKSPLISMYEQSPNNPFYYPPQRFGSWYQDSYQDTQKAPYHESGLTQSAYPQNGWGVGNFAGYPESAASYDSQSNNPAPIDTYLHPVYHRVYRRTRRELYSKIEKLFTALGRNGRECLLKSVCEVSKVSKEGQGTFIDEIIKTIFRVRHVEDTGDEEADHYDGAAQTTKEMDCNQMYPECEHSIWNMFMMRH